MTLVRCTMILLLVVLCGTVHAAVAPVTGVSPGTYTATCSNCTSNAVPPPFVFGNSYQFTITSSYDIIVLGQTIPFTSGGAGVVNADTVSGTPQLSASYLASSSFFSWGSTGTTVSSYATFTGATIMAPVITSSLTSSGTVGMAYAYQITAINSPVSYSASGLPSGLTVNPVSGAIAGTPSASGTANVTVSATNSTGTGSAVLVLTINPNSPPTINAISNVTTNQNTPTSAIPITFGDPNGTTGLVVTATSSNTTLIPNGNLALSGSGASRTLIATPATSQYGTSTITVTVSDGSLSASTGFTITVNAVNQPPLNTVLPSLTGYNSVGQTLTASTGTWTDLETAPGSLIYAYQWWKADDTAGTNAVVIGSATSSTYTVQAGDAGKAIRVRVSATDGGYGPAAAQTTAANSAWTAPLVPPVVTSTLTAAGVVGTPFTYQITATNTPNSYSAIGLPAGLFTNGSTGAITGTPTAGGTFNVTLAVTNPAGLGTATLVLTITATPAITSTLTATGTVGTAFTYQITGSNTPTSFNASSLPAGLSVNPTTGAITGTPTTAGTSNVTITATNAAGSGSATLVVTIAASSSSGGGSSGSSGGGGGGGGCSVGAGAALILAFLTMVGLRRRQP